MVGSISVGLQLTKIKNKIKLLSDPMKIATRVFPNRPNALIITIPIENGTVL
jgi:hypothetical protein